MKKADEFIVAKVEIAKRASELVISNIENTKLAAEQLIKDIGISPDADKSIISNVEKAKYAAELAMVNVEKAKLAAEIVLLNKEVDLQKKENLKLTDKLFISNVLKAKRAAELVIANGEKAKRAAKLVIANVEKAKHALELIIAEKELSFEKTEKQKNAAELFIANIEKAKRAAELVIANVEKAKRATELVIAEKELVLFKEKALHSAELDLLNKKIMLAYRQEKLAKEKYRHANSFNESLIKAIPFAMDIVDEAGKALFQSDNFSKIVGENNLDKKLPFVDSLGETKEGDLLWVIGNRIFEICQTKIKYKGQKAILEIFQDKTEQKVKEMELIKAKEKAEESDRLKSAFLTNMSHEIRTPMNGILGFADLLKEPTLTVKEQQDFIDTIGISGERMLNTINSIVDIAKIEAGMVQVDIKEANINDKMLFTYNFFKPEVERKGLQFLFRNPLSTIETNINTDNEKVYAILANLIKNSIKFTKEGSIEFGFEKKGEFIEYFVRDTGVGIPDNQKELIFERFRQGSIEHNRGYEGSGLGLSISKSYVEMLGGRIWVHSEEGLGSTFYFTIPHIPVSREITAVKVSVSNEFKELQEKKLKILVVEDDEISYSLLERIIQKISKEVMHAETGIEAVETCFNNPDFDLILMDIRMPEMNGLEATQRIRKFNKDAVIIAQTAYGFSSDIEKALQAGCNDYIAKPIKQNVLFELINKHCKV